MPRARVIQEWRCRTLGAGVVQEDVLTHMCGTSGRISGTAGGCSGTSHPVAHWGFHSAWQFEISDIVAAFPRVNNSKDPARWYRAFYDVAFKHHLCPVGFAA